MDGITATRRKYIEGLILSCFVFSVLVLVMLATPRSAMAVNAPTALTATAVSTTQINLVWSDNSTDETGFLIERDINNTGAYSQIATVVANVKIYSDTRLADGSVYTYRVRAYKGVEYSAYANSTTATTRTAYAISAPSRLPASALSSTQVVLTWTDNSNNEAQFQIERGTNRTGPFSVIGTTGPNITTFTDSGLASGVWYYYQVRAVNYDKYSGYTSVVVVQLWTITASAGVGGSISPAGTVAVNFGDSKTFSITPNSGYGIASVLVDNSLVGTVNSYPFPSIYANHTIAASFVDIAPPTGSVVINSGSAATNDRSIILTLSASDAESGVSNMRFSWDNIIWYGWEPYATSRNATIPVGPDGSKTIYTQFRDVAGNVSVVYSDSIAFDTIPPLVTISSPTAGIISTNTPTLTFTVTKKSGNSKVGVRRSSAWFLDMNGNGVWENGIDVIHDFGVPGDIPVAGDWDGDGKTKIGVLRGNAWLLDMNGNGVWEDSLDVAYSFGDMGDIPVLGDWNGDGKTKIGVFRNGEWYLDYNGNGVWDDTTTDRLIPNFGIGILGAIPVTGDWNGDGKTEIGVYGPANDQWYIDYNGNGAWDGPPTDGFYLFGGGLAGVVPVTGDWNGDGKTRIGVFSGNSWYLDINGNGAWENGIDVVYNYGVLGDIPVAGDWTGTGPVVVTTDVNGIVVNKISGNRLEALPDGSYTVTVAANDAAGNIGSAQVSFTVDTTPPTVSITPVISPTDQNTQMITGSRESNIPVTVTIDTTASAGPVSYPTATSWSCNLSSLTGGVNNITAMSVDPAGNVGTAIASIFLYNVTFPSVSVSRNAINTFAAESTTIFFTINTSATTTVTLKIIPEKGGDPVYNASQTCPSSGAYMFTWAGQDDTGKIVPDEAYIFILEAVSNSIAGLYNPPAPTGTGTVTCSQSPDFDPAKNLPMTVTYTPAQPSRVNVVIDWGSQKFKIVDAVPATPESHTFDWSGRHPSGKLLDIGAKASCSVAALLRENHIITSGDAVQISELKTDPYMMHLSYGQFTRIKYTLSRDANVTLTITSRYGTVTTIFNSLPQIAGPHEIAWNGIYPDDPSGKTLLATEEGDYMVTVQAVNPITGTSSSARANVRIGY